MQNSGTEVSKDHLEKSSYLLMTTSFALKDGSSLLYKYLTSLQILQECQVHLLLLKNSDEIGIFSGTLGLKDYTISFFSEREQICLAILPRAEHGQPEPVKKPVITKEKFSFLKLATWLSGVLRFKK